MTTLIVEDGTKPANANTYISLADASDYAASIGNADWAGYDDETLNQALVLATQSVDLLYGDKFISFIYPDSNQSLLWPRAQEYDANYRLITENSIPTCLKNAVVEIAMLSLEGVDIFPIKDTASVVSAQSMQVGGIAMSTTYFKPVEGASFEGFRKIDLLLRPILKTAKHSSWRLVA